MIKHIPTFSTGIALTPGESRYPYLWKGLVGMWCPSVGKQGNNLVDLSLFNRPGTLNNMTSTDYVAGINGYALNYDGLDDFVDIGNISEINDASQDISIVQWVRTTASASNCFWYYDANSSLSPGTDAYLITPGNLQIGGIGQGGQIGTGVSVNDGLWHLIGVVLKGGTLFLYKDGIQAFSTAVAHNHANYSTSLLFRIADNANVQFHDGDIGNTFLYNRALEPSEMIDLFNERTPLIPHIIPVGKRGEALQEETETIQIVDSIIVTDTIIKETDSLLISDSITVDDTTIQESDVIQISDSIVVTDTNTDAKFISKIISVNPLIFVTDTSPLEIIKVDITDPENITFEVKTVPGVNSAKDVAVNTTNDFIYIAGEQGQVIKVEIADLSNQIIIDVSDTDDLLTIETNSNFGFTYAGTENAVGELYLIDERSTFLIDSDFNALTPEEFQVETDFRTVKRFNVDSDLQVLAEQTFQLNTDFKCLTKIEVVIFPPPPPDPSPPPAPSPIVMEDTVIPIDLPDYQVFIDSVELADTDLILNSISITHSVGQESLASFRLSRKHDQINTTLEGNTVIISNQNQVEIRSNGVTIFPFKNVGTGRISELDCRYNDSGEFIQVNALSEEATNQFNNITMSLPSLNSRLSLYDILIQNPKISDPFVDPENEDNPKKFKGIRVNLGTQIEQHLNKFDIFDENGKIATQIQDGIFNPLQNWTYFWSPTVVKIDGIESINHPSDEQVDKNLENTPDNNKIPINERKPWIERRERQQAFLDRRRERQQALIDGIGGSTTISPKILGTDAIRFFYIGTSLAPVSEDLWDLELARHFRQRIYDDIESSLGFYEAGEAPFQEISIRNGVKIAKPRLVDENTGLFSIKDAEFNFIEFSKAVADLELEKLKNINGNILPDTSCTFNLTIDGYLYYDISLLTRINVDNTTESGIYKDLNGFPVSVKSIIITSSDRRVTIQADNTKSTNELEEINGQFPDEDDEEFNVPATRTLIYLKSDMRTRLRVQ